MHLSFIVPAPFTRVSGGYAYDRHIVAGLRDAGHTVDIIELRGRHPLADDTARDDACNALDRLADSTRLVIDGLGLPAFDGLGDALAVRGAVALIHHPTALETGFSDADRALLRGIEQRLLRRLSRIVVTSQPTAERLAAEFGADRGRIDVVTPGTDAAARCIGSGSASCEILSVGTLVPRKGHDVLLRALVRLRDLQWRLTIAGSADRDPVYARSLRALAVELGIAGRVRFIGEVVEAELEQLWRGADLFALATWFEGYGMAVAEALKRGLPVAITRGGAAADLVGPEAGIVCDPGDTEQLSKALRRVIFGAALRQAMAEAAWQTGRTLPSWPAQVAVFARALGA